MTHETLPDFAVPDQALVLFRTETGTRLHLPACPHLVGTDSRAATPAQRLRHPVCEWSLAQIGGYGREHFDDVQDAMRHVGVPVNAHEAILAALRFVDFDELFVVHSLTYGALASSGRTVAGFGKTYYWVGDRRVNLPSYVAGARSGHSVPKPYGVACPIHHVSTNLLGVCDDC